MQKVGLWQIIDGVSPSKIQESSVDCVLHIRKNGREGPVYKKKTDENRLLKGTLPA
jgi:hypothetical protein